MQGSEFSDYVERLSHVKGRAWSYENEIRMIIPRHVPQSAMRISMQYLVPKSGNGKMNWFVRIGYGDIKRVDFGPRVNREQARLLINELKQLKDAAHIGFYEALLKAGEYAYTYRKVS